MSDNKTSNSGGDTQSNNNTYKHTRQAPPVAAYASACDPGGYSRGIAVPSIGARIGRMIHDDKCRPEIKDSFGKGFDTAKSAPIPYTVSVKYNFDM